MIKRYEIKGGIVGRENGGGFCGTITEEKHDGKYVLYSDVAHLIQEKTLEQHRERFEVWAVSTGEMVYRYEIEDSELIGEYTSSRTRYLWQAWKAAKGIEE